MILVMGDDQRNQQNTSYTPWSIDTLDNHKIKVFGITLGKTTIQDANVIFALFPETRLIQNDNNLQLLAIYHNMQFSGLQADIELLYGLDQNKLQQLKKSAIAGNKPGEFHLSENVEISLLNSPVSSLIYKPAIDYDIDMILQRFGTPDSEQKISDGISRWTFTEFNLDLIIDTNGPDKFIYSL